MPDIILPDTQEDIIAGILRDQRRRKNAAAASRAYLWEFDKFTISGSSDLTHTLSWLPYGVNNVSLNGVVLVQDGTDVTVDYTTGVVTLAAAPTAGDVLTVSYVTTGEMKVLSSTPDTGLLISDTFNRANSSTTVNPASDGGTWIQDGAAWGISSNRAYQTTNAGDTAINYMVYLTGIRRDLGKVDADITGVYFPTTGSGVGTTNAGIFCSYSTTTSKGYGLRLGYSGTAPYGNLDIVQLLPTAAINILASTTIGFDTYGISTTFRFTHDGSGHLAAYVNGTQVLTYDDSGSGFGALGHYAGLLGSGVGTTWDSVTAS